MQGNVLVNNGLGISILVSELNLMSFFSKIKWFAQKIYDYLI